VSFPRYPTYKNTGTDWLGEVPEHWSVNRFKLSVESCTNGVWGEEASNDENDVTCIRVADFDRHRLEARDPDEPTIRNVSDRDIEQRSLRKGDLLIEKSGGGEKQPVGAVVLYTGTTPAVCSNFVARMRLKWWLSPSFWRYAHHAAYSLRVNTKSIKQTSGIQNLDQKQYLDESAAYPSLEEQLAIASFLGRETAKIDALIAEQQRLIELLQEKRQAVISHAVTKGLNPNAPMKDSGVEWLGEVPEHWETGKIKHYFRTTSGSTPNSDKPELYYTTEEDEQGTPWIRTTDIDNDEVNAAVVFITPKALEDTACKSLPVNTVLVALYGGGGTVGKNGILKIEAAVNQALCGILPSPKALPEYVHKYIQFLRPFWMERAVSARKAGNISQELVGDTTFPIPPLQEQTTILRAIEEKLEELDELAKQSSESLVLLEERRSALISAAVTGQIDVRGLAEVGGSEQ